MSTMTAVAPMNEVVKKDGGEIIVRKINIRGINIEQNHKSEKTPSEPSDDEYDD